MNTFRYYDYKYSIKGNRIIVTTSNYLHYENYEFTIGHYTNFKSGLKNYINLNLLYNMIEKVSDKFLQEICLNHLTKIESLINDDSIVTTDSILKRLKLIDMFIEVLLRKIRKEKMKVFLKE